MTRFLAFALVAGFASASPITLTFTGTADGMLGTTSFTQQEFTIIFTTDTSDVVHPSAIPVDWSTPMGTLASFVITGVSTGTFIDDQAVFVHPSPENDIGIWHYNAADWVAKTESAFASYDLQSSIGPISDGVNAWPGIFDAPFTVDVGGTHESFVLSNITDMTFSAEVTSVPSGVPEPSTAMLLSLGIAGIAAGRFRRRK